MSCGMVPDGLAFQLGRNGVSLTLSFLSLRHWSISSSQLLAGPLIPACASIGSLYMRTKRLVKYGDRKSTRLNSSHVAISYAVFCLKKKIGTWLVETTAIVRS